MELKTRTETRIENGQDINNTWEVISAEHLQGDTRYNDEQLLKRFKELFPLVQGLNKWARGEE